MSFPDMGSCSLDIRKRPRTTRREDAMTEQPDVLYDVQDRIATITLNRPERLNAYNAHMAENTKLAMAKAASDPNVRVIVLTGAGRGFCAGADMEVLSTDSAAGRSTSRVVDTDLDRKFESALGPELATHFKDSQRFAYFARTKKPIIAAINGPAAGIGLVMTLYADMRFAAEKAVFTTSFAQRGLIAEHGISWLLPRLVGQAHALDLLMSARKISAEEAQVWKSNFQDFNESLATADAEMKTSLAGPEFKEGVAHFLEKRAPRFADI